MSRNPIAPDRRLGLLVVAILTIGVATITAFAYWEMRAAAIAAARLRLKDVASQLAGDFAQSALARLNTLQGIADDQAVAAILERPAAVMQSAASALLQGVAPADTVTFTLELWDAEGKRLIMHGTPRDALHADTVQIMRRLVSAERPAVVSPLYLYADTVRYVIIVAVTSGTRTLGYVVLRQPVMATAPARRQLTRLIGSEVTIHVGNADGSLWTDLTGPAPAPPIAITGDTTLLQYQRPGTGGQFAAARRMEVVPWSVLVEFPRLAVLQRTQTFLEHSGTMATVMFAVVGLLGWRSARRVTEPLQDALRASESRFRGVVEASPNGMVMVDQNGRIVLVNAEVERRFGFSRGELLGQPVEQLLPIPARAQHPNDRAAFQLAPEARQMGKGRDVVGTRKDGSPIPMEVGLSPVDIDGRTFMLATLVDISERKAAEVELRRSNEELQRFAYVASHDLQEPLRTVASYVQLLERRYADKLDSDAKEFIAFAVDGARRMQQLVQDLLELSRVGTREKSFVWGSADVVLDGAVEDLHIAIDESNAVITRDPLPRVYADPVQLRQLFTNLIGNAIKFRGVERARVEMTVRSEGRDWVFGVRDHGIGIEPQYFDRIFVIFQRLHGREAYPGTGIGLAICKKIVERHGGRIWAESTPGDGTLFSFTLPALQES